MRLPTLRIAGRDPIRVARVGTDCGAARLSLGPGLAGTAAPRPPERHALLSGLPFDSCQRGFWFELPDASWCMRQRFADVGVVGALE